MQQIKTTCQNCGQTLEADAIYAGEMSQCPTCGAEVQLPELPANLPRRQPPRRPNPALLPPSKPTPVWDEYLTAFFVLLLSALPALFFGSAALFFLPTLLLLGHLGAIAKRLKAIETILSNRP